jgi:hypothetical protein
MIERIFDEEAPASGEVATMLIRTLSFITIRSETLANDYASVVPD